MQHYQKSAFVCTVTYWEKERVRSYILEMVIHLHTYLETTKYVGKSKQIAWLLKKHCMKLLKYKSRQCMVALYLPLKFHESVSSILANNAKVHTLFHSCHAGISNIWYQLIPSAYIYIRDTPKPISHSRLHHQFKLQHKLLITI